MIEPNFGESQLQQIVNTALTQFTYDNYGGYAHPIIPTLVAERMLGWDSGFHFPWLPYLPIEDQEGCNFFIQYKQSTFIEGTRGAQRSVWNQKYFRFKIPHTVKQNGLYVKDFHQYESLKLLSDNDCEVYYATNHLTDRDQLFEEASSGVLLDRIPFMDLRDMPGQHTYATFTSESDHFYLHSDPVKVGRLKGVDIFEKISEFKKVPLEQSNDQLFSNLRRLSEKNRLLGDYLESLGSLDEVDLPSPLSRQILRFNALRFAYRNYLNLHIYRI